MTATKEKAVALESDGSIIKLNLPTMKNSTPTGSKFQYLCSFCWRDLPNNSIRFDGIGACPVHFRLAKKLVNGLRRHRRDYHAKFNKLKQMTGARI